MKKGNDVAYGAAPSTIQSFHDVRRLSRAPQIGEYDISDMNNVQVGQLLFLTHLFNLNLPTNARSSFVS